MTFQSKAFLHLVLNEEMTHIEKYMTFEKHMSVHACTMDFTTASGDLI